MSSDRLLLSENSQIEATSVSFVADLELLGWDRAVMGGDFCLKLETRALGHLCLEEHRQRVIVIVAIAVVDRLCHQYVILVEIEVGAIIRTGLMGSVVGHEVEHLAAGNGERVH